MPTLMMADRSVIAATQFVEGQKVPMALPRDFFLEMGVGDREAGGAALTNDGQERHHPRGEFLRSRDLPVPGRERRPQYP